MYGLSVATNEGGRNIPADVEAAESMPTATLPWWKSLSMMNENKGVFGLNLLKWWDEEGNLDRLTEPLMSELAAGRLEPVVAESFPFELAATRRTRFIGERRNVGKVVLFPS